MPPGRHHPILWSIALAVVLPVIGLGRDLPAPSAPSGLQDLLDVQKAVKSALQVVRPAVVALETRDGAASGVIVTPDGLILTAAHVTSEPGSKARPGLHLKIILSNGHITTGTALGMDTATDAAMVQIDETRSDWPFVGHEETVTYRDTVSWFEKAIPNAATREEIGRTAARLYRFA